MAKFNRKTGRLEIDPNEKKKRATDTKEDVFLYKELGFPRPFTSITYEESLIFTKGATQYYTKESLDSVKEIIGNVFSQLSIGKLNKDYLFDLGNSADTIQMAYLMLRYVRERGYPISKLITSYDCQRAVLHYSSSDNELNWENNFETELAVILIQGGTPISYIQSLYQERLFRGKRTIMFLENRANLKNVLRDLCKSSAKPDNAIYIGLQTLKDLDYYDVLTRDVLHSSRQEFPSMNTVVNLETNYKSKETGDNSVKKQVPSLNTSLLEGTGYTKN